MFTCASGAQKNHLIERVLLSKYTHSIYFYFRNKIFFLDKTLLSTGLVTKIF